MFDLVPEIRGEKARAVQMEEESERLNGTKGLTSAPQVVREG